MFSPKQSLFCCITIYRVGDPNNLIEYSSNNPKRAKGILSLEDVVVADLTIQGSMVVLLQSAVADSTLPLTHV